MRLVSVVRALVRGGIDLLLPRVCASCKKPLQTPDRSQHVCRDCWSRIKKHRPPFCPGCGRSLEQDTLAADACSRCAQTSGQIDRAWSPCEYEGVIQTLIHEFKYKHKEYLAPLLARLMADCLTERAVALSGIDVIVPIPLHPAKLREREFNQSETLARLIAAQLEIPLVPGILVRKRNTRTQTELTPRQRVENLREAFGVTAPAGINGKTLLLVDDVLTTGATVSEAARALKKAGAAAVFALTIAS